MLHNICIAVAMSGERTVARGPLVHISAQNIDCGR